MDAECSWRRTDEHLIGVVLNAAGYEVIGIAPPGMSTEVAIGSAGAEPADQVATIPAVSADAALAERLLSVPAPREGTKQALVLGLLQREEGATLDQLVAATNWLPHTTRAALTGLRRRGTLS